LQSTVSAISLRYRRHPFHVGKIKAAPSTTICNPSLVRIEETFLSRYDIGIRRIGDQNSKAL